MAEHRHQFTEQFLDEFYQEWEGQPANSNEMEPKWFEIVNIPFGKMWNDNQYWLPHVLNGKRIEAHFLYSDDNETVAEFSIRFLE